MTPAAIQIRVFAGGPIIAESARGPDAISSHQARLLSGPKYAMLKLNAAVCSHGRCWRVRRIRRLDDRSIGPNIDNDRQHGLRLRIFDQQTLSVQFAPGPHLIGVDVVVASDPGDPGDRGAGFKCLLDNRSFSFQWMPSVLAPRG